MFLLFYLSCATGHERCERRTRKKTILNFEVCVIILSDDFPLTLCPTEARYEANLILYCNCNLKTL